MGARVSYKGTYCRSWLLHPLSFLLVYTLGDSAGVAQAGGSLLPMWESYIEFWGSLLLLGSAPAVVGIWEVNRKMEEL